MSVACSRCSAPLDEGAKFCQRCGAPTPAATGPDPLLGTTLLGRYTVRRLLGEGSMGKVYLGEQRIGEGVREVAIKVLASARGNDDYIIARFRREATTIASLEHPNIIKLYDYGEENGYFVSVMEFVPGGSLADLIARERVDPNRGEAIAWQIAKALQTAHDKGIVHRDLKPENVLLAPAADGTGIPVVKVVDFGIARRPPQKPGERALTMTGTMLGTPAFMAPEQFQGGDVDRRADVYALGLVVYQMFAGVLPWPARSIPEWMEAHAHLTPTPLRQQPGCAALPPRYDFALGHALEKDPARRTPTTLQLAQEFTGDGAPEVVPEPASPSVRVMSNPNLVGTAVAPPPAASVLPQGPLAAAPARPTRWGLVAVFGLAAAASLALGFHVMRGVLARDAETGVVDGHEIEAPNAAPQQAQPGLQALPPTPEQQRNAAAQQRIREHLREGLRATSSNNFLDALGALERAHAVMRESGAAAVDNEFEMLRSKVEEMAPRTMRDYLPSNCRTARELQGRLDLVQAGARSGALFGPGCQRPTTVIAAPLGPGASDPGAMPAPPPVVNPNLVAPPPVVAPSITAPNPMPPPSRQPLGGRSRHGEARTHHGPSTHRTEGRASPHPTPLSHGAPTAQSARLAPAMRPIHAPEARRTPR
ncbi:MAG: protein kinase [Myxococcales bacterium]|nr:protein kinase [Myxococcales bacterium]